MKRLLTSLFLVVTLCSCFPSMAQFTCQCKKHIVYYQQPVKYELQQQPSYQQPPQYYLQTNNEFQQSQELRNSQETAYRPMRGQRFSNILNTVGQMINIVGQGVQVYQQIRGGRFSQQQYPQQNQQNSSPPPQVNSSTFY